jgi:hypothetical protein
MAFGDGQRAWHRLSTSGTLRRCDLLVMMMLDLFFNNLRIEAIRFFAAMLRFDV